MRDDGKKKKKGRRVLSVGVTNKCGEREDSEGNLMVVSACLMQVIKGIDHFQASL